jgi:hypothetical protein
MDFAFSPMRVMNLRILLARRISKRLARAARVYRRALSDHLRQETSRIRKLEIRSRGLRLYAAWSAIPRTSSRPMPRTGIKPRSPGFPRNRCQNTCRCSTSSGPFSDAFARRAQASGNLLRRRRIPMARSCPLVPDYRRSGETLLRPSGDETSNVRNFEPIILHISNL